MNPGSTLPLAWGLGQRLAASLALRWALVVTLVAGTGLGLMVYAVGIALRAKIEAESARLTEIAEQKVSDRLDIEARLADQRLRALVLRSESALQDLAGQPVLLRLLRERDERRIAERLQADLPRIGYTGAMLFDANLLPVGGDRADIPLAAVESGVKALEFHGDLQNMLAAHSRRAPLRHRALGPLGLGMGWVFQSRLEALYGLVSAVPIFDEFGDAAGVILAYRVFAPDEATLAEFAETVRAGLVLAHGDQIVTRTGNVPENFLPPRAEAPIYVDGHVFRCVASLPQTRLCILRDDDEVVRFRNELKVLSESETTRMQTRLGFFASGLAILIGGLILLLTRRLTGPMTDMAGEVARVAEGEWTRAVRHADRADEVGRIARAIEAMQIALIERDRMRQEMIRIDAINQRRLAMGAAVGRFESGIGDVMAKMGEAAEALGRSGEAIGQAARSAEEHANRIQQKTLAGAQEATFATGATLQLTRGIAEIEQRLKSTRAAVETGGETARAAGLDLEGLTRLAGEAEDALEEIQGLVADLAQGALSASMEATRVAGSTGFSTAAGALARFTAETAGAAERLGAAVAQVTAVAELQAERISALGETFGQASRDTAEMAVVMAEQDAARRSISEGLAGASGAMTGLNEAVEELRLSLQGAAGATQDVLRVARTMIADAQAIDTGLRSFVREVVA
jgi:methyl-accepting chemotaxis protein